MRAGVLVVVAAALLGAGAAGAGSDAPGFRVQLGSQTRTPAVGARWVYRVRAVDARGRAVGGTAVIRVLVGGRVVDTVGWFAFKGTLRRSYRFGTQFAGTRAVLQATVIGPRARLKARYPVRIRSYVNTRQGRPAFQASVRAWTRAPSAGTPWRFRVRAVDRRGRAVGGTAVARIVRGSRVVDTIGWFGFRGSLSRFYRWPSWLKGTPAVFQVKVIGPGGSRTIGFAIRVR